MNFKLLRKIISINILNENKKTKGEFANSIPIIILDTKTDILLEYSSISEAARFFNTYPKKIWRILHSDRLYLNRYKISVRNNRYKIKELCLLFHR